MSRQGWAKAVRLTLGAFAVGALVWAVVAQWADVSDTLERVGFARFALATSLALVALAANTVSWRSVMAAVGLAAPLREAAGVFLVSQAGKYVPGAIWPVVAQTEFARGHGVSRARAATGSLVAMAVGVAMAGVVGGATLAVFAPGGIGRYWWALAVAVLLLAALTPPVLTPLVRLALRVLRRDADAVPGIGARPLAVSAAWSAVNWLALGAHAWVLLGGAGATASFGQATGAFALAWLVGFLAVFAPAGLFVREAALVALLAGFASQPQALALAVLSRFAMTLADAIGLGCGALLRRWPLVRQDRTSAP